ncbi:MAG: LCP family protein [Chloroflexota bacterium]|nr:LCP family protein [Chloroflexota bacterium]
MWRLIFAFALSALMFGASPTRAQDSYPDAIPEAVALLDEGDYDITNYLLLGSDTFNTRNIGRTDVIVILSINRTAGTVAMLSLPRDLYVYIPDDRIYRINTAFAYGVQSEHPDGGIGALRDTIRYNLGIEIDHYARVDFTRFRQIVDDLGGVNIAVDCIIEDWRLIEPTLDPSVEENWAQFRLGVGVHEMDGDLALWYARSRRTTSDFDRGRRHQQLLRALWRRIQSLNLVQQVADVYPQLLEIVETDIGIDEMLSLVPLAASLDPQRIASYTLRPNVEVYSWSSPEGSSVLAINWEALRARLEQFYTPPTALQTREQRPTVEIINATGYSDLAQVAAERLAWDGFIPIIGDAAAITTSNTVIYDLAARSRDSSRGLLQRILRVDDANVVVDPNPNRAADYRVVLGGSYGTCNYNTALPAPPTDGTT